MALGSELVIFFQLNNIFIEHLKANKSALDAILSSSLFSGAAPVCLRSELLPDELLLSCSSEQPR